MRIGLVTACYEEKFGGNEYYLAKTLSLLGHEVFIYVSPYSIPRYGKSRKLTTGSSLPHVHVCRLPVFGWKNKGLVYLRGLTKQIKKDKIDIVHLQEWFMPMIFSLRKFPNLVVTQRINDYPLLLKLFTSLFASLLLRNAAITALTSQSKHLLSAIGGISASNIMVIPNGVDVELFKPTKKHLNKKTFRILSVARLSPEKGLGTLIKACKDLPFDYELVIVGRGPQKKILQKLIQQTGLSRHVHLIDFVEHTKMPEVYSSADLFVLPSLKEPFGFAVLEALSCNLPVIGTRVGGLKDIITKEVGEVVHPGDVASLRQAILHMRSQKKKYSRGRGYVRKFFSYEKVVDSYLEVYKKVLEASL